MTVAAITLGSFEVMAGAAEVAAFREATGIAGEGETLPLTYPIRWMAAPEIRAGLTALVPEPDIVPFHESQTFDYASAPRVGEPYTLAVRARREAAPDRLVVEGTLTDATGATRATLETVLRLFSTAQGAA